MKIAHVAIATPGRCGLYETTRELAHALRLAGHDARIFDPQPTKFYPGSEDRGVPIERDIASFSPDVLLSHSGLTSEMESLGVPIFAVSHGRPRSSFNGERQGKPPVWSYNYRKGKDERYAGCITFWPQHVAFLSAFWGDRVHLVDPTVDLQRFKPGKTTYVFDGKAGSPNIVVTDPWRDDLDPFEVLHAAYEFARTFRYAKVHLYALPENRRGIDVLIRLLRESGNLGVTAGWVKGLENVYRAADMLITPHTIHTRSIREAMACGCQVVTGRDADPADPNAFAEKMAERLVNPQDTRAIAERLFDPKQAARQLAGIVEGVACGC